MLRVSIFFLHLCPHLEFAWLFLIPFDRAKYGIAEMCRDQWKWASQNPLGYQAKKPWLESAQADNLSHNHFRSNLQLLSAFDDVLFLRKLLQSIFCQLTIVFQILFRLIILCTAMVTKDPLFPVSHYFTCCFFILFYLEIFELHHPDGSSSVNEIIFYDEFVSRKLHHAHIRHKIC